MFNRLRSAQAETIDRRLDLRAVSHDKYGQLLRVNVFLRHGGHVGERDLFESIEVGLEGIGGVAVELEVFALVENFLSGVVTEEKQGKTSQPPSGKGTIWRVNFVLFQAIVRSRGRQTEEVLASAVTKGDVRKLYPAHGFWKFNC